MLIEVTTNAFVEEKFDKRSPVIKAHGFRVSVGNEYMYVYTDVRFKYVHRLISHSYLL